MCQPIRILHVVSELNRCGAETMIMNYYRNIDRTKVQFDFVIHTDKHCDYTDEIKQLGGRTYSLARYNGINMVSYINQWEKFFQSHSEYRVVHGHMNSVASIYLAVAKKYKIHTIVHSHSTYQAKDLKILLRDAYRFPLRYIADYFFACSNMAGLSMFGRKIIESTNYKVLTNAIEAREFVFSTERRMAIRKEYNLENKYVVGHVGRMMHPKNHGFLIDVFKAVHDLNKNTVLMLVGDGELRNAIEKKVVDLDLTDNVLFTGVRSDISDLLLAMDVFVFPSLFEGLGIAAIEAQASGLRAICADTIPEEAKITDLVEFLPLSKDAYDWARIILKDQTDCERKNMYAEICAAGYDIKQTAGWLEKFYTQRFVVLGEGGCL